MAMLCAVAFWAACGTPKPAAPAASSAVKPPVASAVVNESKVGGNLLQVGELVGVTFTDLPPPGIPEFRERIGEDGTIVLPLSIKMQAAGKTLEQLERDIHDAFIVRLLGRVRSVKVHRR